LLCRCLRGRAVQPPLPGAQGRVAGPAGLCQPASPSLAGRRSATQVASGGAVITRAHSAHSHSLAAATWGIYGLIPPAHPETAHRDWQIVQHRQHGRWTLARLVVVVRNPHLAGPTAIVVYVMLQQLVAVTGGVASRCWRSRVRIWTAPIMRRPIGRMPTLAEIPTCHDSGAGITVADDVRERTRCDGRPVRSLLRCARHLPAHGHATSVCAEWACR
jgi:hypothetical protein